MKVGVVIAAKNEEHYIEKTLRHLISQTLKPNEIVVINDGSTDNTAKIAEKYKINVINLPDRGFSVVGSPILLQVRNLGLKFLKNKGEFDYILILDADHILPKFYLEKIISRMEIDSKLVIASGRFYREAFYPDSPIESGRVYVFKFLRDIGFFPINYAGEDYPLFKALKMGYKIRCFEDLVTWHMRPMKLTYNKLYYLGKGMRALGYDHLYFLGKFFFMFLKSPKGAIGMLSGYISSDVLKYHDLKEFTKNWQRKKIIERLKNVFSSKRKE
ncbi:MAG: glycosyltransferase family 2 protein [Candidatus Goldbacteria bacterium]|nr:glycosyltransferase family 2 protein [Candidatus Goldiibacteriota bacterium]